MSKSFDDILRDVPRGVTSRRLGQQARPQARWQDPEKNYASERLAYDPKNPGSKLLVGAIGDKLIGIEDNRHALTVAGSRSGKSVSLIGNLLFYRGSILATDPKGELAAITARRRAELGQRVCVLDPFGYTPKSISKYRASYNPLSVLYPESPTIIEDANLIADAMIISASGAKDPHWDDCARDLIEGLVLHIATDPAHENARNLLTLRDLINRALIEIPEEEETDELFELERAMLANAARLQSDSQSGDLGRSIEGSARGFFEKTDKERDGVLSTVRRHTKFLDYSALRSVLSGHDFDLADLKRDQKGLSVYLCFPATRTEMASRWLRIFINQLLDAMEREKTQPKAPVLACLDEFPVLGYMRQIETAAGQIASFGVKLWTILQDWSQGKALYGDRWETFAANAGIMQFFSNNDLATTEYIAKRLGKTLTEVSRSGEVGREQEEYGLSGRSSSAELHDLLAPEEISRLFSRDDRLKRQLVLWSGYHPMILQRAEYFDTRSALYGYFKGTYSDC